MSILVRVIATFELDDYDQYEDLFQQLMSLGAIDIEDEEIDTPVPEFRGGTRKKRNQQN